MCLQVCMFRFSEIDNSGGSNQCSLKIFFSPSNPMTFLRIVLHFTFLTSFCMKWMWTVFNYSAISTVSCLVESSGGLLDFLHVN